MELQLGLIKTKDLAKWFNISYSTFRKSSSKYYEKLSYYCEYERVYGGVEIKEIYLPVYDKKLNLRDQQLYLEEIKRCVEEQDGLSTLSGMSRKFLSEKKVENCKEKALSRRLSKVGEELFGSPKNLSAHGSEGSREYVWAIKVNDYNVYRPLTKEEVKIFDEIIVEIYQQNPAKIKLKALLEENYRKDKNMSKEEYFEMLDVLKVNTFKDCLFAFAERTGNFIVRCTKHELYKCTDFEESKKEEEESAE